MLKGAAYARCWKEVCWRAVCICLKRPCIPLERKVRHTEADQIEEINLQELELTSPDMHDALMNDLIGKFNIEL